MTTDEQLRRDAVVVARCSGPWFGPPWYAEMEDPDAFWAAIAWQFVRGGPVNWPTTWPATTGPARDTWPRRDG